MDKGSSSSTSLSTLAIVHLFDDSHSSDCSVVWVCISLRANGTEHLPMGECVALEVSVGHPDGEDTRVVGQACLQFTEEVWDANTGAKSMWVAFKATALDAITQGMNVAREEKRSEDRTLCGGGNEEKDNIGGEATPDGDSVSNSHGLCQTLLVVQVRCGH